MLARKIYPLFLTGPYIKESSDRKYLFHMLNKRFTEINNDNSINPIPIFKMYLPDWLANGKDEKKIVVKKIMDYCFKDTFSFESVLNELALEKIMFPSTTSSIYELAQFNNRFAKDNTILIPKKHRSDFNNNNDEKPLYKSRINELGLYIKYNHHKDFLRYNNKVREPDGFPNMSNKWIWRFMTHLKTKYQTKEINYNLRIFPKNQITLRNDFAHLLENDDEKNLYIPVRLAYSFMGRISKNLDWSKFENENFKKLHMEIEEKLIEEIKKTYKSLYIDENFNDIRIYSSALKNHFNKRMLYLTMLLVAFKTRIPINDSIKIDNETYKEFYIGKRKITSYSDNINGDLQKKFDSERLCELQNNNSSFESDVSFAYKKLDGSSWILNSKMHIDFLYQNISNNRKILKVDIANFFGSMKENKINSVLKEKNIILQKSITEQDIKQGLKLAPTLSNIYLNNFDEKMEALSSVFKFTYSRYSDDILCCFNDSSEMTPEEVKNKIIEELKKINLIINEIKTSISLLDDNNYKPVKVVGVIYGKNNAYISTRKSNKLLIWCRDPVMHGLSHKYLDNLIGELDKANIKIKEKVRKEIDKIIMR